MVRQHQIAILQLDLSDSTCDQIKQAVVADQVEDPATYTLYLMKMVQCRDQVWNKKHPEDPRVTVVTEEPAASADENPKVLFNTLSAKTVDDVGKVAKTIITAGAAYETDGDPLITGVASIAGNYTVEAYVNAAKNNDPLIILLPTQIPNIQLGKDAFKLTKGVYQSIAKLADTKPVHLVVSAAAGGVKGAIDVALIGPKVTNDVAKKVEDAANKTGNPVIKVAVKAAVAPINIAKRVFHF